MKPRRCDFLVLKWICRSFYILRPQLRVRYRSFNLKFITRGTAVTPHVDILEIQKDLCITNYSFTATGLISLLPVNHNYKIWGGFCSFKLLLRYTGLCFKTLLILCVYFGLIERLPIKNSSDYPSMALNPA